MKHVAYAVADIRALMEQLKAKGVDVVWDIVEHDGTLCAFVRDNSGNMVEFVERSRTAVAIEAKEGDVMLRSFALHDIPVNHIAALERWYYRDHAPEIVRRYGPWLARFECYLPVPAPGGRRRPSAFTTGG